MKENKKELHVHLSPFTLPQYFYTNLYDTENALKNGEEIIHTSQTHVLSTTCLLNGYRIFAYMLNKEVVELKLGYIDKCCKEIRPTHNLEKMVLSGCFGKAIMNDV